MLCLFSNARRVELASEEGSSIQPSQLLPIRPLMGSHGLGIPIHVLSPAQPLVN